MFRLVSCVLLLGVAAIAQQPVPVIMLSDIHFDPFHNPRLVSQLRAAPVERWAAILDADTTLTADADRVRLDADCHSPAADTAWPLLKKSLEAARNAEPHPGFVTVSGDLLAHGFPCRFQHASADDAGPALAAFSAKTVAFVALEVRLAFPHVPVYLALGNNDSGCGDYDETPGSAFLQSTLGALEADAQARSSPGLHAKTTLAISPEGDYSVALPAPIAHSRLIVLDDIFESANFRTCAGVEDRAPAQRQIAWLRAQLTQARAHHEQVWVMGHLPPGIDVFRSFAKYVLRPGELCSAQPRPFLADTALSDTLLDFADVIRLALFAHTHMDEFRLLHRAVEPGAETGPAAIPIKLVPSISPIFGNHPAFLVAEVDPRTLVLKDWRTVVSPALEGSTPPWAEGYRFSALYRERDFSAVSAARLAAEFTADRDGRSAHATAYREHFYAGGLSLYSLGLQQIWPAYACSVREDRAEAFHECLCPTVPQH